MKRNFVFKLFFLIFCFFLSITFAYADECTTEELRELKQLAKKVEFWYDYSPSEEGIHNSIFVVKAYNLNEKFYLKINDVMPVYYDGNPNENIDAFSLGSTNTIKIYASSKTKCEDYSLTSFKIELPMLNLYSYKDECKGKEKNNICKKWYDTRDIVEEEFYRIINELDNDSEDGFIEKIKNFFYEYWCYLLIIILSVSFVVVTVKMIKKRNRKKIEI